MNYSDIEFMYNLNCILGFQLTSDTRKEEFIRIFNVAGKKLGSPFNDVAICFQWDV